MWCKGKFEILMVFKLQAVNDGSSSLRAVVFFIFYFLLFLILILPWPFFRHGCLKDPLNRGL
jgi:hypothetical protein